MLVFKENLDIGFNVVDDQDCILKIYEEGAVIWEKILSKSQLAKLRNVVQRVLDSMEDTDEN